MSERVITNNILIAHEMLHSLKAKRTGKLGYMALKLDMSKAYDRVEWIFLEKIMLKMGGLVKNSSTSYPCVFVLSSTPLC